MIIILGALAVFNSCHGWKVEVGQVSKTHRGKEDEFHELSYRLPSLGENQDAANAGTLARSNGLR